MNRWADPQYIWWIFLLIPLVFWPHRQGRWRFSSLALVQRARPSRLSALPAKILLALSILCLGSAVMRPQKGKEFTEIDSEGVDIMLAIDTSGSMEALDFKLDNQRTDRLSVVKKVVSEFVQKRQSDRLGLVVFGSQAFTQCPLTLDHNVVLDFVRQMEIGMAGEQTAIGQAMGVAIARMRKLEAKSKILILLTDGVNNAGTLSPAKATELAQKYKIKIYTIGVGHQGKVPFKAETIFGPTLQYAETHFDEPLLRNIAQATGGKYFAAENTKQLEKIYDEIDQLEKSTIKTKEYTEYQERYAISAGLGLILLLIYFILRQTWWRRSP